MKKKSLSLFFLVLSVIIVFSAILVSCGDKNIVEGIQLDFIVDGEVYHSMSTTGNEIVSLPQDPTKEGYVFDCWYWDKDSWNEPFTAKSLLDRPITENLRVYARFITEEEAKQKTLSGADVLIDSATHVTLEDYGEGFCLAIPSNHLYCAVSDYVVVHRDATWTLTEDIKGKDEIPNKTVFLDKGKDKLLFICVTNGNKAKIYPILIHRKDEYTVYFVTNGGNYIPDVQVEEGEYLIDIPTPTRDHYSFAGWDFDFKNKRITGNVFAHANWIGDSFTAYFYPNGGTVSRTEQLFKYGSNYSLVIPEKNGYAFDGWHDRYGNEVNSTGIWEYTEDMPLYAYWDIINYDITYDLKNGINTGNPSTYTINDQVSLLEPTKRGYEFLGWTGSDISNISKNVIISVGTTGDKNYTANWQANTYTITFDVNNGDALSSSTLDAVYDSSVSLPTPTRLGYDFTGWKYDTTTIYSGIWNIDIDITLVASWSPISYDIVYVLDGGINNENNPSSYTIEDKVDFIAPTKTGYEFTGWTGTGIQSQTIQFSISTGTTGNISLTAHWNANTYTITYNVNGGDTLVDNTQDVVFDSNCTLVTPTRTGYTFEGWINASTNQLVTSGKWQTAYNPMLIAYWSVNNYSISYTMNGGINNGSNPNSYTYIDYAKPLYKPTKPGFVFTGWYLNNVEITSIDPYINSDITIEARWASITLNKSINEAGSIVTLTETYSIGDSVKIVASSNTGYTWVGWYNGNTFLTDELTYTFTASNNNVGYTATWVVYTFNTEKNISEAGTTNYTTTTNVTAYNSVTITATTNAGFTWVGWYNGENELTTDTEYTFNMPAANTVYTARWTRNTYTITIDNQASSEGLTIFGVTSGNKYDYDSKITLSASNIPSGYRVAWRNNGVFAGNDNQYSFNMPACDVTIEISIYEFSISDGYVYFGTYPQTQVIDETLISNLSSLQGTLPTSANSSTWTDCGYYAGGQLLSYMWYKDVEYNGEKYRGVYFTAYRPKLVGSSTPANEENSTIDNYGYTIKTVYWFKYETIKWRVLAQSNGKAFLLADKMLDAQTIVNNTNYLTSTQYAHNGGTGYGNNYKLSDIRIWLNNNFINKALTMEKVVIYTTNVDNSVSTTGETSTKYICENTNDKLFLLSYTEATNSSYGLGTDNDRKASRTNYAAVQGITNNSWWLRSPHDSSYIFTNCINTTGGMGWNGSSDVYGVRPACWIDL